MLETISSVAEYILDPLISMKSTLERYLELPGGPACHLVITRYSNNRVLVVISNTGTFGSIVHARKEQSLRGGETYSISMILGDRNDRFPELCVRMVMESGSSIWKTFGACPSFVFCVGLQRHSVVHKSSLNDITRCIVSTLHELFT